MFDAYAAGTSIAPGQEEGDPSLVSDLAAPVAASAPVDVTDRPARQLGIVSVTGQPILVDASGSIVTGSVSILGQPILVNINGQPIGVTVSNFPAIQPISAAALPLPAGAATEATLGTRATEATLATRAAEATLATRAAAAQLPAALAAGGGLKVEGVAGGVAQPISAAALPLPAGAATAANQATEITAINNIGNGSTLNDILNQLTAGFVPILGGYTDIADNVVPSGGIPGRVGTVAELFGYDPVGNNFDRLRALGDNADGVTASALGILRVISAIELVNAAGTLDRLKGMPTADGQAVTGLLSSGLMMFNAAGTYDRLRGMPAADAQAVAGILSSGLMMLNPAGTYDRAIGTLRGGQRVAPTPAIKTIVVTGAAAGAAVATLPAAGAGLFHYITHISIRRVATALLAGGAILAVTSANLGGRSWRTGNQASITVATADGMILIDQEFTHALKTDVAATNTVITCPAPGAAVSWQVVVDYYEDT